MKIKPFKVEEWMNEYEDDAPYNIAETCVDSISLDALFELVGKDKNAFLDGFCARRLTYGDIFGAPAFKEGICRLYKTMKPENIIPTHGAAGANHHVFYSLLEPGDRIVSIMPTYQQLYSIPESFGVEVDLLHLKHENGYHPDLKELERMVTKGTKMICINNPNNPTGALMEKEELLGIIEIARQADAWILCDEVYRHLTQTDVWSESVADLYEKGISVSGMSKVFSLAGLRLGWIATRNQEVIQACLSHRDYTLISCGMFDEQVAGIALEGAEALLKRNRGVVRENLARLDAWVNKQPHVSWHKPQAGTTALLYYDLDIPSRSFCEEMYHRTGAFVTPGECFEMEYSMRIGYACAADVLEAGLAAMDQYIQLKVQEGTPVRKEKNNG
jgi:aspartate/methionine/tyrosine aminotransferase